MTELRASDTVAAKIRGYREWLGWSRREMAEHCGLSESVIENIESGRPNEDGDRRRDVTIDELLIICRALDISLLTLLPDEAAQPSHYERERALQKRREREAAIEEQLALLGKYEADLQRLAQERASVEHRMREMQNMVTACRERITMFRAERD